MPEEDLVGLYRSRHGKFRPFPKLCTV